MKKEEIMVKIGEIISFSIGGRVNVDGIDNTNNIVETFGVNSIEAIEIIVRIENEFEIDVDDNDLSVEFLSSLDKISDYVLARMN